MRDCLEWIKTRQTHGVWAGSRGCPCDISALSANEFRQRLKNACGGAYVATNWWHSLCSNTLIVRRTLFPAHRAWSVIAAGSQHLSRSRPCCLTKITLSESWSMLQWVWFSAWAGLSLLDSFSKNVRKIKSAPNQWVSFWIKPLLLGSQKSVSKETYSTATQQIWNREGDTYFSSFMKEKLLFLIWFR